MSNKQRTIKKKCTISGIGLHTGKVNKITLSPAFENFGICLLSNSKTLKLDLSSVKSENFSTKFCANGLNLITAEHLLSALFMLGIDNLLIEVYKNQTSIEIPILDGSSIEFIQKLKQCEIVQQSSKRKKIVILKKISLSLSDKYITIEPNNCLEIDIEVNLKSLHSSLHITEYDDLSKTIASARTFGFLSDKKIFTDIPDTINGIRDDNCIIFDDNLNPTNTKLRFTNEPVKHKILDMLGDLYSTGFRIQGKLKAINPGHKINVMLMKRIFSDTSNYKLC